MRAKAISTVAALLLGSLTIGAEAAPYSECIKARDSDQRLKACEAVIRDKQATNEQRARAHRERGSLLAEAGSHADAVKDFTQALQLEPKDARAFESRGLAYLVLGEHGGAIDDLTSAINLAAASSRLFTVRGYVHLVAGAVDLAIADFDKALELTPKDAVALNNRGLAYRRKGDVQRALADYEAAISVRPTYALAHANRGYALEVLGRTKDAIEAFENALKIDPNLSGASAALSRLGQPEAQAKARSIAGEGKTLATLLCSRCHAIDDKSASPHPGAPPFRSLHTRYPLLELSEPITRGIAAPHKDMPAFALTDADIDRIIAFVNTLGDAN